jgi:hypothetical protein
VVVFIVNNVHIGWPMLRRLVRRQGRLLFVCIGKAAGTGAVPLTHRMVCLAMILSQPGVMAIKSCARSRDIAING